MAVFSGIRQLPIAELGVCQLYLNEDKLARVREWLDPLDLSNFEPVPVYDFGDGKLTLTDGHSRAFVAYMKGIENIPCIYETDQIVISKTGQMLYENDIRWCACFGISSVCDLKDRVLSNSDYQELWIKRCDKAYNLLTQTSEVERNKMQLLRKDLSLYGANEDLSLLYFENEKGVSCSISNSLKGCDGCDRHSCNRDGGQTD